jgi:hypothetical protein
MKQPQSRTLTPLQQKCLDTWPQEMAKGLWYSSTQGCFCAVGHMAYVAGATLELSGYSSWLRLEAPDPYKNMILPLVANKYNLTVPQVDSIMAFSDYNYLEPQRVKEFVANVFKEAQTPTRVIVR